MTTNVIWNYNNPDTMIPYDMEESLSVTTWVLGV